MLKMSEVCKETMIKEFKFNDIELVEIENFMNNHNNMITMDILESLIRNKKLKSKQKIVIAYIVGNSSRNATIRKEKETKEIIGIELPVNVPTFGG